MPITRVCIFREIPENIMYKKFRLLLIFIAGNVY